MPNIGAANIAKIRLAEQGSEPASPAAGFVYLFAESDGIYAKLSDGTLMGPFFGSVGADLQQINTFSVAAATELTIDAGAITVSQMYHSIDTEIDAASDNLDTINGLGAAIGSVCYLRASNTARTVILKHGTGNIYTLGGTDITLDNTEKVVQVFGFNGNVMVIGDGSAAGGDLKADGTVPLTANWDVGAFKITANQLESDVAAGTAPLVVASDTVVANLNAAKVGGISPASSKWPLENGGTEADLSATGPGILRQLTNGAVATNLLCNYAAIVPPAVGDDVNDGYAVGSIWHDVTHDTIYMCIDATAGAAKWPRIDGDVILSGSVAANAASVSISGWPDAPGGYVYKSFELTLKGMRCDLAATYADNVTFYFNADTTAASYDGAYFRSLADAMQTADSVGALPFVTAACAAVNADANMYGNAHVVIFDPTDTHDFKHWIATSNIGNTTANEYGLGCSYGMYESANAITSITFLPTAGTTFEIGNANEPVTLEWTLRGILG